MVIRVVGMRTSLSNQRLCFFQGFYKKNLLLSSVVSMKEKSGRLFQLTQQQWQNEKS